MRLLGVGPVLGRPPGRAVMEEQRGSSVGAGGLDLEVASVGEGDDRHPVLLSALWSGGSEVPATAQRVSAVRTRAFVDGDPLGSGVAKLGTLAVRELIALEDLDLVALATVADCVPLRGENRRLVRAGLKALAGTRKPGLRALMRVARADPARIDARCVQPALAPRINAAGRMDIAKDVVELFTCRHEEREQALANKLNELNAQRQAEEQRIVDAVRERLDRDDALKSAYCLVIDGDGWHRGVIGIVATRVVERTHKPALVVARDPETGEAHGSGRSIPAFHLLNAIESEGCKGLFTRFGGHAFAVGFALPSERVEALRSAVDAYARTKLTTADFVPQLAIDAEIEFSAISKPLLEELRALEPFGAGNREPVLMARNGRILRPPQILKEKHVKLRVAAAAAAKLQPYDALGWRMAEQLAMEGYAAGDVLDIGFTLEENDNPEFGGLQLILSGVRRAEKVQAEAAS